MALSKIVYSSPFYTLMRHFSHKIPTIAFDFMDVNVVPPKLTTVPRKKVNSIPTILLTLKLTCIIG